MQATAIYQAKQKLQSISRANKRPVPSEDLIKFAHRINIEMRLGFLGRLSDMPINGPLLQQQNKPPTSQQNQFAWHPSGEIHMSVGGQGSVAMDTRNHNKENEDVEVMSTDSSSSSSSDSQ
uniref:Mediator of RNA polymerase II transcription subunit 4 n=1 Tax=Timema tahoe TaxID=61484 RepID=A0A7R9P144_9NEOP|nr:unnamed protein product [Timema tahoe]